MGKVGLFLRPGQAGAQPRGPGHSAGPGVHGPRESGAGAALQATGLFILQTNGLRLEALNPALTDGASGTRGRSLESDSAHPVPPKKSSAVGLGNYNSQEAVRQELRWRLRKRQRRQERRGRVLGTDWSGARAVSGPAENARLEQSPQTSFLPLVAAAEAAWISANWTETVRAAVA